MKINSKKMVLVLTIFVMMVLMVKFSVATPEVDPVNIEIKGNETDGGANNTLSNYGGIYFLKNTTSAYSNYSSTIYLINISISENASGAQANISTVNITLPAHITFISGSNRTNASSDGLTPLFTSINNDDSTQTLKWNSSAKASSILNNSADAYFYFAVTVAVNATDDGSKNILVRIANETEVMSETYTLSNITVDNTRPTISSATTKDISGPLYINVTFSESMFATSFNESFFNTTRITNNATAASGLTPNSGNTTTVQLTVIAFNRSLTPDVTIFGEDNSNITDLAGNRIAKQTVQASDGISFNLYSPIYVVYSYYTKNLTFTLNESVGSNYDVKAISIYGNADARHTVFNITLSTETATISNAGDNVTANISITLNDTARDRISEWNDTELNLTVATHFINDTANNALTAITKQNISGTSYTKDTNSGNLTSAIYLHYNGTLVLTFNETVDVSTFAVYLSGIVLSNQSNVTSPATTPSYNITLEGATITSSLNTTTVGLTLTDAQRINVSSWVKGRSTTTLYVSFQNISVYTDIAGNPILPPPEVNQSMPVTETKPTSSPRVEILRFNKTTGYDSSFVGPWVTTGLITMLIQFNQTMDTSTDLSVNISQNGTTVLQQLTANYSGTDKYSNWNISGGDTVDPRAWNATFNITSSIGDGTYNITIGGAKDIAQLNTIGGTLDNYTLVVDQTGPQLLRAYIEYNNTNRTNATSASGLTFDTLVLQFSENLTFGGEGNISHNASMFNLTVEGDSLNESNSAFDIKIDDRDRTASLNRSKVRIRLGGEPNITVRGVYNPNYNSSGSPSGINVGAGVETLATFLEDMAGNKIVPNASAVDIADGMVKFIANSSNTFSVPYCVNTTLMNDSLSKVTGACSSYTTGSWSNAVSGGNFLALRGYRCVLASPQDFELYIYTENRSRCALLDHQLSLTAGYNLVGVDGAENATALNFLAALKGADTDASAVTSLYIDVDNANTQVRNTGTNLANTRLLPVEGFWVYTTQDDTFNGNGLT